MSPANTKKLYKAFPHLYRLHKESSTVSPMHWGFCCGDGWFGLIFDLSKQIQDILDKIGGRYKEEFAVAQVKQKFGGLRFYIEGTPIDDKRHDEITGLIQLAERRSFEICEECGENGKLRTIRHYVQTLCDKHDKLAEKNKDKRLAENLAKLMVMVEKQNVKNKNIKP